MPRPDDDTLDGCEIDFTQERQATDDEVELWPLFAEALDPNSPVTVEQAQADWEALFSA